jgi:hypothetical protein
MINNFELIKPLLKFENENDFYFVQILKRKKENPEQEGNSRVIKTYYITSQEYLEEKFKEMIILADLNNARVYINLNKRNFEKCALKTAQLILEQCINKDYKACKNAFDSICGRYSSDDDKKWVVDVDTKIMDVGIIRCINYQCEPISTSTLGANKIYVKIPTKNGFHLITTPFNCKTFNDKYPDIDVHKNNPTLIYIS